MLLHVRLSQISHLNVSCNSSKGGPTAELQDRFAQNCSVRPPEGAPSLVAEQFESQCRIRPWLSEKFRYLSVFSSRCLSWLPPVPRRPSWAAAPRRSGFELSTLPIAFRD